MKSNEWSPLVGFGGTERGGGESGEWTDESMDVVRRGMSEKNKNIHCYEYQCYTWRFFEPNVGAVCTVNDAQLHELFALELVHTLTLKLRVKVLLEKVEVSNRRNKQLLDLVHRFV